MTKKILIAEDDRAVCQLLKHVLEGYGFEYRSAYNGVEALQIAETFIPDLIIMDVNMPQMDGLQLLAAVKSSPTTSAVPVIMCTEKNQFADIEKANDLGCNGYVTKPITIDRLLRKIRELLR